MKVDPLKLIFVHIPKTAGQAITRTIANVAMQRERGAGRSWRWKRWEQHWRPRQYKLYYPDDWDDYLTFAVIRNPYARAMSAHRYTRQRYRHTGALCKDAPLLDPGHMLRQIESAAPNDALQMPQRLFLNPRPKRVLRHETLAADWRWMVKDEGLPLPLVLPIANAAPDRIDLGAFYLDHPKIAAAVRKRYRADFDHLPYDDNPAGLAEEQPTGDPAPLIDMTRKNPCCH